MNYREESDGESMIKALLKKHNIYFKQEYEIYNLTGDKKNFRKSDFYLPDNDLHIEFQGMWNDPIRKKKYQEKMRIYRENGINCIYIYPSDLSRAWHIIREGMEKYPEKINAETIEEDYSEPKPNIPPIITESKSHFARNVFILLIGLIFLFILFQTFNQPANDFPMSITKKDSIQNQSNQNSTNPTIIAPKYCDRNEYYLSNTNEKVDYNQIVISNTQISTPYKNKTQNIDIPSYVTFDIHNNNPYPIKFEITYEIINKPYKTKWTKSYTLSLEIDKNNYLSIKEATDPCGDYAISGGSHCQFHIVSINEIEPIKKTLTEICVE